MYKGHCLKSKSKSFEQTFYSDNGAAYSAHVLKLSNGNKFISNWLGALDLQAEIKKRKLWKILLQMLCGVDC
jgi:hypothetical protein